MQDWLPNSLVLSTSAYVPQEEMVVDETWHQGHVWTINTMEALETVIATDGILRITLKLLCAYVDTNKNR